MQKQKRLKMQLSEQVTRMKALAGLKENAGLGVKTRVQQLLPQLAAAAQKVYDEWDQDEEGLDDHYGGGGICDDIAGAFGDILASAGLGTTTHYNEYDFHTSAYAYDESTHEIWKVDIHPFTYETGAAYTWKKIPGVHFTPNMIDLEQVEWENFFDENGDGYDY